ncbi:MAG: hypothetical protein ACE15B_06165 [Bryobacteraceae bacterium]
MKTERVWTLVRLGLIVTAVCLGSHQAAAQNGQANGQAGGPCTVNGKTYKNCPPALQKQAKREAARQNAGPQKKGVRVRFAGVKTTAGAKSPLAPTAVLGAAATAAVMTPGAVPDYFGVGNYANSPLPQVDPVSGAIVPLTGVRKFVDALPGLCAAGVPNGLGQCIPLATANTALFPGSDYYQIGLSEYAQKMHSDLPPTHLRGYTDLNAGGAHQYLGPLILATRNRPVRILFKNQIATDLNIPMDSTYMGAGLVSDATSSLKSSQKRATLHLHGGNTPWISDGTTHQWVTPAGGDGQPAKLGFAKGYSFENVPDMVPPGCVGLQCVNPAPSAVDGMHTFYWTNQQSGRLMFFHDHAYGITRLNVYAGEAAGYLLVDPAQESTLKAASAPGTIVTDPTTGGILSADLAHRIPLVIQDKTFVPDLNNQLPAQDPTWDITKWGSTGDLWFPHIYSPNQNPADISGANGFGRWDWGPWFWPPQSPGSLTLAPYACNSIATPAAGWAFPPLLCPGVPDPTRPAPSNSPSGTPEGFMDTPVVNGTAYPTLAVDPTAYRFDMLNAANDRALNLGLYVADPLAVSVTAGGSGYAPPPALPPGVIINGCTGAAATATVDANGVVIGVTVTNPGTGCVAPTVAIAAPPAGGTQAYAIASMNTEVKMVPAVAAALRTLPDCPASTALPMAGGGQVTTTLTTKTGLPAGCWPQYNSTFFGPLSWPTDAREGGVPDPTTAGPPIIQIGAEGGVLPQLAVIPSTPVSYDYNKRSITVLNVLNHGLWLGPAERADVIVDFSQFAGQTLILYNDSPAPVPAGDPRLDYYTNNPDFSATGGAPTTMAGYGPNMRTIMQIKVNSLCTGTCTPLNLPALTAAIPNIFSATQDAVIVPEPVYPVGHGNGPQTYIPIQANSVNAYIGGPIGGLTLTSGGAGYTAAPTVAVSAPCVGTGCITATATANLAPTSVRSVTLTSGGSGYTSAPAVTFSSGGGAGATATATLATRSVASVTVTNGGNGYTTVPTVAFSPPPAGTTATGTAVLNNRKVASITITNPGTGYVTAPAITITGGGGSGAAAAAVLAPAAVASVTLTTGGSGYTVAPTVSFAGGGGTGASASATLTPTVVASLTLTNGGSGYTSAPSVTFTPPQTAGSTATALALPPTVPLLPKTIQELFTLDYGRMNATLGVELPFTNFLTQTTIPYGYSDPPTELFKDGETQLWKITHNGVDTHFMHFHLFTVQVINRVGWDGAIKPPDPYELGLKDTVRMNPLEDIIVALRPFKQTLPFAVPSSSRPMNVTRPVGYQSTIEFTNVDPQNNPAAVTNNFINFGWEYVWHCHILGHEENDMMRAMILAVSPTVPTAAAAPGVKKGTISLALSAAATPSTAVPSGFTIQRATALSGPWTNVATVGATLDATRTQATATFLDTTANSKTTYYYRVTSNNRVGYTQTYAAPAAGYPNTSADSAAVTTAGVVAP